MTTLAQPQPVTDHPSITGKLLKPFLGLFHGLLPIAWFMAFVFAAIMSPMALLAASSFLLFELSLIIFTILSGTYLMRYTALEAQKEALERVRVKQIAGAPADEDELEAANAFIPSFQALLKRNLIVSAFYIPLVGIMSGLFYGSLSGGVLLIGEVAESRFGAEAMLRILVPVIFVAWVFVVTRGWGLITRFVDGRLLKTEIKLPVNEETRQKHRMQALLREARKAKPQFEDMPLELDAPSPVVHQTTADASDVPLSTEPNAKLDPNAGMSSEMLAIRTMYRWFMRLLGAVVVIGFLLTYLARSQGMSPETVKIIMIVVLGGGMLGIFVFMGKISDRVTPQSSAMKRIGEWETAMRRADYATLLPLSDEMMQELPNFESKIPAAAAYAQAGQFERAEEIAREALQEISSPQTDVQRDMFKTLLGQGFGLLMEIYTMSGRLNEAEDMGRHALEFDDNSMTVHNSVAKLHLLYGDGNAALPHIDIAAEDYLKNKTPATAYNKALRAWGLALLGDREQADALMVEGIKQTPPEHVTDLAELYWIGGHIAKVQKKYVAARMSFEKAAKLDPNGAFAQIAERELKTL